MGLRLQPVPPGLTVLQLRHDRVRELDVMESERNGAAGKARNGLSAVCGCMLCLTWLY